MFNKKNFAFVVCFVFFLTPTQTLAQKPAYTNKGLPINKLTVAPGFRLHVYADNVPFARQMALGDKGTVFVGSREYDKVHALVDTNKDNVADEIYVVAEGLNSPNGVAFKDGALYIAEIHRVIRLDNIENNLADPPQPVVVNDTFPPDTWHGWKYIRFGPDGKLYIPVGAPCNVCEKEDERYGTIMRMNADGSGLEIVAKGVRNSVGFDWHPLTNELWFTDNGRDLLGDDLPPDELNLAPQTGMHFGFPYCHGKDIPDPEFGDKRNCSEFTPPATGLGAHVAALGMKFYRGNMFPEEFKHKYIFVAEHGSWDRTEKVGYRVAAARLMDNVPNFYGTLVFGWLDGDKVWGRPVDLLELPDGSMLISDDHASAIYRLFF
ncbi:MAG TPA: PQQ-dependent sugar dehydrogenase [Candidatus Omnitrophota bacterium]|nr:PQQ-dependent sugar dehydrogenase [Candidatus Omnitrophota bacterium]